MTYNIDIINLFINHYINGCNFINISEKLNISIFTLKRLYYLYKNNIINKIPLLIDNILKNKKIHGSNKKDKYY
jgi:hypothetical protein